MILFNDTELFTSGTIEKKIFDLPDADLLLIDSFFTKEESDNYYTVLLNYFTSYNSHNIFNNYYCCQSLNTILK